MSYTTKVQKLIDNVDKKFKTIINLNKLDRVPLTYKQHREKVITLIDKTKGDVHSLKPLETYTSNAEPILNSNSVNSSAIYAVGLDVSFVESLLKNKTLATQHFSLILNNALIEMTNAVGSHVVRNNKNKLMVRFLDTNRANSFNCIEMRVILDVDQSKKGLV